MTLLAVRDLSVSYGKAEVVHGVSLEIDAGQIVTVIGANGAGKTTLMNAIMGLLPSRGSVRFKGTDLRNRPTEARVRMGMSLVAEKRELFGSMSVEDNLRLGGFLASRADSLRRIEEVYRRFPRLQQRRPQAAGTLSGGERQMLAMGRALMAGPSLLLLDEPSLGLAPIIVREIFSIVTDLRKAGVSILLVEQNARAALQVADHGYVMELGQVTLSGPASQLAADRRVLESYLGFGRMAEDAKAAAEEG